MNDIKIDSNHNFIIQNGDFLIEDSNNQEVYLIAKSDKGWFRNTLKIGLGIDDYLNSQDYKNIKSNLFYDIKEAGNQQVDIEYILDEPLPTPEPTPEPLPTVITSTVLPTSTYPTVYILPHNLSGVSNTYFTTIDWGDGTTTEYDMFNSTTTSHTYTELDIVKTITLTNALEIHQLWYTYCGLQNIDLSGAINLSALSLNDNKLLTDINIDNNTKLISIMIEGCALPSSVINYILAKFVEFGHQAGNYYLKDQTPPAPPTGQGIIDKNYLLAQGHIITTD